MKIEGQRTKRQKLNFLLIQFQFPSCAAWVYPGASGESSARCPVTSSPNIFFVRSKSPAIDNPATAPAKIVLTTVMVVDDDDNMKNSRLRRARDPMCCLTTEREIKANVQPRRLRKMAVIALPVKRGVRK